jgi:hypothetical protein
MLPLAGGVIMEQAYWLSRMRASLDMARAATTEARLIHYDLAGRYSIKAADAGRPLFYVTDTPPPVANARRSTPAPSVAAEAGE